MRELTLFGGWAKAQIPTQTGNGALTTLVMRSPFMTPETRKTFKRCAFEVEQQRSNFKAHSDRISTYYYNQGGGPYFWWHDQEDDFFLEWLFNHALFRYFELWPRLSWDLFDRGIAGKGSDRIRGKFAGTLGGMLRRGALQKNENEEWVLADQRKFFRRYQFRKIRRLSAQGAASARAVAFDLRASEHRSRWREAGIEIERAPKLQI